MSSHRFARTSTAIVTTVLVMLATTALAIVTPPEPRVFASATGRTGLKILPKGNSAVGICFTLNEDGTERVRWRRDLVNVPGDVVILDGAGDTQRLVVTLDTHGMLGGPHALVVYDAQGKPSVDAASTTFVPEHANPPANAVRISLGQPWRTAGWSVRQSADQPGQVDVHLGDGRVAKVNLAAKQIVLVQVAAGASPATTQASHR